MATFVKLGSGNWRVQVRRKGRYVSETFRRRKDADEWALDIERRIDKGEEFTALKRSQAKLLSDLIDIHLADMQEVGRPTRRSKAAVMDALKARIGKVRRLADPSSSSLTISAIAYDCGFGELSWFNKAFKKRFWRTPSDVRNPD